METMVKDLVVGDRIQTLKNGIVEVVSTQYTPFPNVSVNCMTAEGHFYTLGLKKESGHISYTRGHKPNEVKQVVK